MSRSSANSVGMTPLAIKNGLLTLCGHARKVFAGQPTRLFLHGFYLRGSLMELWVFDRSGIYSCDIFDLQTELARLISILRSYRLMTDRDLGRSDIVDNDEAGSYITLEDAAQTSLGKLYLEDQPIALSEELVGEGTTCYRAKMLGSNRWDYVVKFKWRLARDRPEEELLKLAKEKNVWGVVSLDYHKDVDSIANLRQGLRWGPYRKLLTSKHQTEESEAVGVQEQRLPRGTKGIVEHTEDTNRCLQNRIFTYVVVSPAERPLRTFKTMLELLQVLRDAVKGHRSLFQDAKILHQDVSAENIIITDGQGEGDPKGILIDLDVAMNLAVGPRTPGEVIGTRAFMAIGVLRSRPHRYRHDLESFLYVFLWTIISNRSENPPRTSKLRQWSRGSFYEIATRKTIDMDKENFRSILEEFTPEFHSLKPLAETLRQILFPLEDGAIWTGTDSSPEAVNVLYDGIIGAFDEAITFESRKLS
ncbi:hypothetical protein TOPH_09086 [Tolypocladium ophioglossoides CBS 100239]|uniref:Fungal-type protein kinase domain-containing protein n=1 Tax=Tolypocladium ophioglossoides (strain CBS 100239) TaxID=1163406 RepID=A0A0L0MWX2_TOLOC|nr:hypothetical protein TOPH_09086 [Tolypocladium ophioglossoides CBS 100239]